MRPLNATRAAGWSLALLGLLGACILIAASLGAGQVSLLDVLSGSESMSEVDRTILWQVRLPRVLLAALLGGALTVAGVVFQALLRNPLADPYVLGVSGGASVGGVIALLLGLGGSGVLGGIGVPAMAFAGALGALLLIQWVATVAGRLAVYTVLLTGAIFNAFSAALIYFLQSVASLEELHAIVFYLMGQIPSLALGNLGLLAVPLLLIVVGLFALARDFNALSLGEEGAAQIGVDVDRVKRRTLVLGSLLTGSLAQLNSFGQQRITTVVSTQVQISTTHGVEQFGSQRGLVLEFADATRPPVQKIARIERQPPLLLRDRQTE